MGIRDLISVINDHAPSAIEEHAIKHYFGKKIVIDASVSIAQFLAVVRRPDGSPLTNVRGETTSHLFGIFYRTIRMVESGIKPVYVFDGQPPQLKLVKRQVRRDQAMEDYERAAKARKDECKKLLKLMGIPFIDAPGEAEVQCAALVKAGKVYATGTENMAALAFGSKVMLRQISCSKSKIKEFNLDRILAGLKMTYDQFVDLCILLGCDYCGTIRGIGPKKAYELITQHKSIENVLKTIDTKKTPPPGYWPFEEVRKLFTEPEVLEASYSEFSWTTPDEQGLIDYMVNEKSFNKDRIITGVAKLKKGLKAATIQGRANPPFSVSSADPQMQQQFSSAKGGFGNRSSGGRDARSRSFLRSRPGAGKENREDLGHKSKKECPNNSPNEQRDHRLWEERDASGTFDHHYNLPVMISGNKSDQICWKDFSDADFPSQLMANLKAAGYEKPTPIQQYAMRWISLGRDLMACAETGSGKTVAFLLPILSAMMKSPHQELMLAREGEMQEPIALIVEPTRELAIQVMREARKFGSGTLAKPAVVYGGVPKYRQRAVLRRGCNILIATPGRLLNLINSKIVGLSKCKFLVLDEADRMLNKGLAKGPLEDAGCFRKQTMELVRRFGLLPPEIERRQTLMFSATFSKEIQKLAMEPYFLNDPVFIVVGQWGAANIDIKQEILRVPQYDKRDKLIELLTADVEALKNGAASSADGSCSKLTLVFVERKRDAANIATFINASGLPVTAIHRPLEQVVRERNLGEFRSGQYPILVATSVAARGLHIEGVDHVINFDMSLTIADYVHRIGRTGRMGKRGRATSFFDPEKDSGIARKVLTIMTDAHQDIPPWFTEQCKKLGGQQPRVLSTWSRRTR